MARWLLAALVVAAAAIPSFGSQSPLGWAALPPAGAEAPAPPDTRFVDNELVPERNLDDCISALPQPDCGSAGRGGWRQTAIFGLLVAAIAFIAWRIIRSARKGRAESERTDDT